MAIKGIAAVYKNKLEVELEGEWYTVPEATLYDREISSTIQTWKPMEAEGWDNSVKTGISHKYLVNSKRVYNDTASDAIAGCANKSLSDVEFKWRWTAPNNETVTFTGVCNVTKDGGGETEAVNELNFEIYPKGKPTFGTATQSTYEE